MTGEPFDPRRHYDRVTAAWTLLLGENLHYGLFDDEDERLDVATERLTDAMRDAARLTPGLRVLDVGCGTGAPACRLATEDQVEVVGISTSEVGIEAANARAARLEVEDRVTFEVRDGMENGLEDRSFDRVWVMESSHLMADRGALIAECSRVLRPGGRLVLCDLMLRAALPFAEVRSMVEQLSLLRRVFGAARMEPMTRYEELARNHGLVVEEAIDLTARTRPTFARWRDNARHHASEVERLLDPAGLSDFVAAADVLETFWDDGTMGYGLMVATR